MDVYEIKITKGQLQSLPEAERILVLQFGHVCNELSFLNKLLLMVSDTKTKGLEKKAMAIQAMIVARLYIGKVFEAWRMIQRDYFVSHLSKTLDTELNEEGKKSLKVLKSYFGKNNLLSCIRNDFSFHYWAEHLPKAMDAFDDSREFQLILGGAYANTLHNFSEEFVTVAMLQASGESEAQAAMDRVIGELVSIGGKMITFSDMVLPLCSRTALESLGKTSNIRFTRFNRKKALKHLRCRSSSSWGNGVSPNTYAQADSLRRRFAPCSSLVSFALAWQRNKNELGIL